MQKSSFDKSRIMAISFGRNGHRSGFTLLELLVTIGLLVLLMSIFATIFQQATRIFAVQRGILANDQRSRVLYKQLEDDLRNISFKSLPGIDGVVPYIGNYVNTAGQNQQLTFAGNPYPDQMKGYLYISENDPNSDTDDVLQFTIDLPEGAEPLAGKADQRGFPWASEPNTPDNDDGDLTNQTMISSMAEVSYFMRGTTLYRRQLLLREPAAPLELYPLEARFQPRVQTSAGPPIVRYDVFDLDRNNDNVSESTSYNVATSGNSFYNRFDLSAHYEYSDLTGYRDLTTTDQRDGLGYAKVHGSLSNDPRISSYPLGDPRYRFGHYNSELHSMNPRLSSIGLPREFVSGTGVTGPRFIGRFTHEETSADTFCYPLFQSATSPSNLDDFGNPTALNSNPFFKTDFDLTNYDRTWRLNEDYSGLRKGEDILMTNVLSFNVEVWDNAIKDFVNLGHAGKDYHFDQNNDGIVDPGETQGFSSGDYQRSSYTSSPWNAAYGDPSSPNKFILDTWHPNATTGTNVATGGGTSFQPPMRRLKYPEFGTGTPADTIPWRESDQTPLPPYYDDAGLDGITASELRTRDRFAVRWFSTVARDPGAEPTMYPPNGPDILVRTGDVLLPSANFYNSRNIMPTHRDLFAYQVTVLSDGVASNGVGYVDLAQLNEPNWPGITSSNLDHDFANDEFVLTVPDRTDPVMEPAEGQIRLKRILNLQPLKAMKITVLFRDLASDQIRQLSYIESLAD